MKIKQEQELLHPFVEKTRNTAKSSQIENFVRLQKFLFVKQNHENCTDC